MAKRGCEQMLSGLQTGMRATVVSVDGGKRLVARLADLGIFPGTEVLSVANSGAGPMLLEVRGARYTLGRGIVQKVMIRT